MNKNQEEAVARLREEMKDRPKHLALFNALVTYYEADQDPDLFDATDSAERAVSNKYAQVIEDEVTRIFFANGRPKRTYSEQRGIDAHAARSRKESAVDPLTRKLNEIFGVR